MMDLVIRIIKWASITTILFTSFWIGNLSYFAYSFTKGVVQKIDIGDVKVSLATEVLSNNWQVLIIASFLYFLIALYLILKVKNHITLYIMLALSSMFTAFTLNILVVSAGFELS